MEKWVRFDPRVFIMPPFVECPKCGQETSGVLSIYKNSYSRRCKNCLYPKGYEHAESVPLPELNKKVIYLDQFVISKMMMAINPNSKAYKKGDIDSYWYQLFGKLDRLCKMQLIVCPDSVFHHDESLLFTLHDELKMVYEHLSYGATFWDAATIRRFQLHYAVKKWLCGEDHELVREQFIHGDLNTWQEQLRITVDIAHESDYVEQLRSFKEQTHTGLTRVFQSWIDNPNPDFNFWYSHELNSYPISLFESYVTTLRKAELGDFSVFPSENMLVMGTIHDAIKASGVTDEHDIWDKTHQFFKTILEHKIPSLNISSALFASIARKVAAGQRKAPNKGTMIDITMLSSLMPYCDAMFIDDQFAGYLREYPVNELVNYNTKIFSSVTRDDFMKFLDDIEREGSTEAHINALNEVYGDSWTKPFYSMFDSI